MLDEVAGEAHVVRRAGGEELVGAGQHTIHATGQRHPLPGLLGAWRRQQVVGLAVVPAAVAAPHVAHDELRVVVHGTQVGLAGEVGRHLHLVQHPVERGAFVHQGEGLVLDGVEQLGRVEQGHLDAVTAEDRHAVAAQHGLGLERGHRPERGGPVRGEALHLLRVAGVGDRPDEQVAGVQDPALGHPRPGGVVGLAAGRG